MKYLAYIESPLQAFNLLEYAEVNKITIDILIVNKKTTVSLHNYSQISFVLSKLKAKTLFEIDIEAGKKNIFKIKKTIDAFLSISKESFLLIGGEYRSMIFWYICGKFSQRKVVILDDGTATLRINRTHRHFKRLMRDLLMRALGFVDAFIEPIVFFSVYDLTNKIAKHDILILHKYESFQGKMTSFSKGQITIYIIGSPFFEAGVIDDSNIEILITLEMINKLKGKYSTYDVVYIPHRRESEDKLERIRKVIPVEKLGYPFELLPLVSEKKVAIIAGFYSSLFDNMYAICGKDLKIECFCLPEKVINPSWSGFVSDVYENYKKYPSESFIFNKIT